MKAVRINQYLLGKKVHLNTEVKSHFVSVGNELNLWETHVIKWTNAARRSYQVTIGVLLTGNLVVKQNKNNAIEVWQ